MLCRSAQKAIANDGVLNFHPLFHLEILTHDSSFLYVIVSFSKIGCHVSILIFMNLVISLLTLLK